jgi:hypothetical protein
MCNTVFYLPINIQRNFDILVLEEIVFPIKTRRGFAMWTYFDLVNYVGILK